MASYQTSIGRQQARDITDLNRLQKEGRKSEPREIEWAELRKRQTKRTQEVLCFQTDRLCGANSRRLLPGLDYEAAQSAHLWIGR